MTELSRPVERLSENEDFLALFPSYGVEECICGTVTPHPECPVHLVIAAVERLEDALSYYAQQRNLHPDFWKTNDSYDNDYGLPGTRARRVLGMGPPT